MRVRTLPQTSVARAHAHVSRGRQDYPALARRDPASKRKTVDLGRCRPCPGGGSPGRGHGTQVARGSLGAKNAGFLKALEKPSGAFPR